MPITSQEDYEHYREQIGRQTVERDALAAQVNVLTNTVNELTAACAVWEAEHPAPAEPDTQA